MKTIKFINETIWRLKRHELTHGVFKAILSLYKYFVFSF